MIIILQIIENRKKEEEEQAGVQEEETKKGFLQPSSQTHIFKHPLILTQTHVYIHIHTPQYILSNYYLACEQREHYYTYIRIRSHPLSLTIIHLHSCKLMLGER